MLECNALALRKAEAWYSIFAKGAMHGFFEFAIAYLVMGISVWVLGLDRPLDTVVLGTARATDRYQHRWIAL
jgi:hypothetical protein